MDQDRQGKRRGASPLCVVGHGERSATWNRGGVIIFGSAGGLQKIPSAGGKPTPVTTLRNGENAHRWPWFLPDDEHFLYLALGAGLNELRVGSLTANDSWSLGPFESNALYAQGHLLFVRGGKFMAQSFDTATRQLAGDPVVLADETTALDEGQRGLFSVSGTGVLGYGSWKRSMSQLVWMDRTGKSLGTAGGPGYYVNLGLSLDDRRVAVSQVKEQPGAQPNVDIWLIDLARAGSGYRLTDDPAVDFDPAWSPDGQHVAFNSSRLDPLRSAYSLFVRPSNGSGRDDLLVKSETLITAPDWSPDGRFLAYGEQAAATGSTCGRCRSRESARSLSFCGLRMTKRAARSRRTAAGSRTSRTRRAAARCTSARFRCRRDSFRSHATEAERRDGVVTARNCFS